MFLSNLINYLLSNHCINCLSVIDRKSCKKSKTRVIFNAAHKILPLCILNSTKKRREV